MFREPTPDEVRQREALEHRQRVADLQLRGIPDKDLPRVLGQEPLAERPALSCARALMASGPSRRIMVLSGRGGEGKTTAAAWFAAQGAYSRFVRATELARMEFEPQRTEKIGALETVIRMVIDDLGTESLDPQGRVAALVDGLVDARYASQLRTLITTNLPRAEFRERYGARIWRRIQEAGEFVELSK